MSESQKLVKLALPVVFAQLGVVLLGFVDLVMLSRYSQVDMNAAGLGTLWMFGTNVFAMGLVFGMDPLVSQGAGSQNEKSLIGGLQVGYLLALLGTALLVPLWSFTEFVLITFGQDPQLAAKAQSFVQTQIPSIPFFLFYMAVRQYLIARGRTFPIVVFIVAANVINGILNYVLIYGHFGFPELGLVGAALSTTLMRIAQCLGLIVWLRGDLIFKSSILRWDLNWKTFRAGLGVGTAVGLQYFFETWGLQSLTVMAGWLGPDSLAAHNILMNILSLCFISALGLSFAVSSRVGNVLGQKNAGESKRILKLSVKLSLAWLVLTGVILILIKGPLLNFYKPSPGVFELASALFGMLVLLQLFDGVQIVISGALRGMSAPLGSTVIHFLGLYLFGIPFCYYLGINLGFGLWGIWIGAAVAFAIVSVVVFAWTLRHPNLNV